MKTQINFDDVRLVVEFTDNTGDEFKGHCASKQFKARTSELIKKGEVAVEEWKAKNGELID